MGAGDELRVGGARAGAADREGKVAAQSARVFGPQTRTRITHNVWYGREKGGSQSRHRPTSVGICNVVDGTIYRVNDTISNHEGFCIVMIFFFILIKCITRYGGFE